MKHLTAMPKLNFTYRIYYEDTDAGGIVYYANYLKFCERARTDMLRQHGFSQSQIVKELGLIFVVRNCQIEYLKPARLDDEITVFVEIEKVSKTSITFLQKITRGEEILSSCTIIIVAVDKESFKPTPIPKNFIEKITS